MKKTISYIGIEKVTYVFSENEILDALLKEYKISVGRNKVEFDVYEGNEDEPPSAELVVHYATEK